LDAGQPPKTHELLIELDRASREPLRHQLERRLRAGIDDGSLPDGARLPSSRSLADQLGVSRGVVVDAYEQLSAQGFLRSHPRKAPCVCAEAIPPMEPPRPSSRYRFVLNPTAPDLSLFPRRLWSQATAEAMRELPDNELDYLTDLRGAASLRTVLVGYLSRVRRVSVSFESLILTLGFLHSLDLLCRALARRGVKRVAVENPSIPVQAEIARSHGLEVDAVAVDDAGLVVTDLLETKAQAVIVTPAHQFPLGTVLSPERRRALVSWARERGALIVENDYDAEFRYRGPPIGALQGLAPERTVYVGTTSKTLAPAVRLGWVAAPAEIATALDDVQLDASCGATGLNGHIFARLMHSGAYERHVQRCRRDYRRRRDALADSFSAELPYVRVLGTAGGLHLTLRLPENCNAERIAEAVRSDGVDIRPLSHYTLTPIEQEPGLVLGYGRLPAPSVPEVVKSLARALRASGR
jgi:GntR family transcriptional regulator/MocR family aminotransferase